MWTEWSSSHLIALELIQFHPVWQECSRIESVTNFTDLARFGLTLQASGGDLSTHIGLEHADDVRRGAISRFARLRLCRFVFAYPATDHATHNLVIPT